MWPGGLEQGKPQTYLVPGHVVVRDTLQVSPLLCCGPQTLLWDADKFPEAPHHRSSDCSALRGTAAAAPAHWEYAQAERLQFNLKESFFIYSLIFTTCGSAQ